jgi:hypothetical protein
MTLRDQRKKEDLSRPEAREKLVALGYSVRQGSTVKVFVAEKGDERAYGSDEREYCKTFSKALHVLASGDVLNPQRKRR